MSTLPLPDIESEAKSKRVKEDAGQELRNRKIASSNGAGPNQRDQKMSQFPQIQLNLRRKRGFSTPLSSDLFPMMIHIVTGCGSWLWPFGSYNGDIYITLFDAQDNALSEKISLTEKRDNRRFQLGELYSFKVPKSSLINPEHPWEKVSRIEVYNDYEASCLSHLRQWHLDTVVVENTESCSISTFPYKGWIKAGATETLKADDLLMRLPPPDEYSNKELKKKREQYQYLKRDGKAEIPAQAQKLPGSEKFTLCQTIKLVLRLLRNEAVNWLKKKFVIKQWKTLDDLLTVYGLSADLLPLPLPPVHKKKTWMDDRHFGYQRINGLNHGLIKLCDEEILKSFPVTDGTIKEHLNGLTLKEALEKKRLFVVDLGMLQNIPVKDELTLCAPIGLFFSSKEEELIPVAIRLERDSEAQVFLPENHSTKWHLAKLWFNNADAIYHQSVAHLGLAHLLMEGVAVATNRQLSSRHPVYKLLKPHFLYNMAINNLARTTLLGPGKYIDTTLNTGTKGTMKLIAKELEHWRLDVNGTLPASLESRGLLDPDVLTCYHYREDALVLYYAMQKYVTEYVNLYYDQPEILQGDGEIQAWAAELARDRDSQEGGCGLKGVPGFRPDVSGDNGKLEKVDQLVTILTSIIFTCSVEHASVNFAQYEEYGYPINYPSILHGTPPRNDNRECNEKYDKEDILKALPTPEDTLDIMTITDVLSQKITNSLGQFETVYFTENKPLACLTALQGTLQEIQREIAERNDAFRRSPYKHLEPRNITNSISI